MILRIKSEKVIWFLRFSKKRKKFIPTHGLSEVAKNVEEYLNDLILILSFSQIWLNLLVNRHHFGYNIKLTPQKKRKKESTACTPNMSAVRQ